MKTDKLKAKLCRTCGIVTMLRVIVSLICLLGCGAIAYYAVVVLADQIIGMGAFMLGMLAVAVLLAIVVLQLAVVFAGVGSARLLRANGRRSCEYLESKGLLQAAAEEYYGKDRYECRLARKNWKSHRYAHRKNVLTPNFIFVMSDNVVLTYDEIRKARFLRADRKITTRYSGFFYPYFNRKKHYYTYSLRMADGTEVALFSSRCDLYGINKRGIERTQAIVTEVAERIRAKNPECEVSRIDEQQDRVIFEPYIRPNQNQK